MTLSTKARVHALRFHDDFDGVASAVLLLAALDQPMPRDCRAVGYASDRASWLRTTLPPHSAVVDFLYHPQAEFWFDHHHSPFAGAVPALSGARAWDANAPSCAGVIGRKYGMSGRWAELMTWADKIDSARWASPAETLDDSVPAVRIYNSLLGPDFQSYATHLIGLLLEKDLSSAANDPVVVDRFASARRLLDAGILHLKRRARFEKGIASVECGDEEDPYIVPRYGAYLLFPEAEYMLLNQRQRDGWKVTLSRNPWRHGDGPHLGEMVTKLGGGGHRDVGAVNVDGQERARSIATFLGEAVGRSA